MSLSLNIEITRRTIQCHQTITTNSYVVLNGTRQAALGTPSHKVEFHPVTLESVSN
jgi:hypothetical protein